MSEKTRHTPLRCADIHGPEVACLSTLASTATSSTVSASGPHFLLCGDRTEELICLVTSLAAALVKKDHGCQRIGFVEFRLLGRKLQSGMVYFDQ